VSALLTPLYELEGFNVLINAVKTGKTPVMATGVVASQKAHLCRAVCEALHKTALVIAASELDAKVLYDDLKTFFTDGVYNYPSKDVIFYSADVHSNDIVKQRLKTINAILSGAARAVVLSIDALADRLCDKDIYVGGIIDIKTGGSLNLDGFMGALISLGYTRCAEAAGAGQFAARGGIIDIVLPDDTMFRIELWDDIIDSVRRVDITSGRSLERLENIKIFPAAEVIYNETIRQSAAANLSKAYEKRLREFGESGKNIETDNLKNSIGRDLSRLTANEPVPNADRYTQFFCSGETTLLDYLPKDTVLFFDEPPRVKSHFQNVTEEFTAAAESRILNGYMLPGQIDILISYSRILRKAHAYPIVLLSTLAQSSDDFTIKTTVSFTIKSSGVAKGNIDALADDIRSLVLLKHRVLFLAGTSQRGRRIAGELTERGVTSAFVRELDGYDIMPGCVVVSKGALRRGFSYQYINFTIISDIEIMGGGDSKKQAAKQRKISKMDVFLDLKIGDYAVHRSHGIGVYRGIEKITDNGINKDYLKLSFSDGGTLYVPVDGMDAVTKYVGADTPKLNKLGGADWGRAKTRARGAIMILAEDLAALYAKRQNTPGFAFSKDTVWQAEFEEGFAFDETDDQLRSIEEVKADMEQPRVMDRLLCGDVGYGKTEVAIRAAFKCAQDGKQVAYLVPTTILAQQHYNTFTQRMKDFPVTVELLSRFRTKKQLDMSMENISKGVSDIAIGTHRLLSKDITFKDLGLVIIDEEQRFGVGHKEKLKRLKENVDVLTLTATPIPRTLHMSLTGLRDLSSLEEPPLERHPVQTYVLEYDPEFVKDAVHRELARGGQVYYLFNRVRSIEEEAARVRRLVPEARVAVAHGQMPERELENIMREFIECAIDVLICTTIIETGLDISNVNTIIVNNADYMGLAQLYQLRGRVGRSNRIAYCYLMYKKDKVLDEVAEKRLTTIREFTEFGSGFKIAMRDLEIRGAGNLLGAQQHGHMDCIGYELYCRMLEEAVAQLRGDTPKKAYETLIDIKANAYIPDYYIENEEIKLEVYKKIAAIENESDRRDMADELSDRFGKVPKCVNELLDVAELKAFARELGINQISQKNGAFIFTFDDDANPDIPGLMPLIKKHTGKLFFTSGGQRSEQKAASNLRHNVITYKVDDNENITPMWLKGLLEQLTVSC